MEKPADQVLHCFPLNVVLTITGTGKDDNKEIRYAHEPMVHMVGDTPTERSTSA